MDGFERLLDGEATDFERSLLDSASDDSPSHRVKMRTLAAMGVGAGVASAAQAAHAATQIAATGATAGASKGAGAVSLVMLLKWVGTGALAGSVVAASVATVTTPGVVFPEHHEAKVAPGVLASPVTGSRPTTPAPVLSPPAAAVAPAPERRADAPRPTTTSPSKAEKLAPPPAELPAPGAPAAAQFAPEPAPSSAVVAEVEALDRARAALAGGDPHQTLALVAKHDAAFPAGILGPEAVVLRVRALVALGDRAQASAAAARFMASHPNSAQAARLRAIVNSR